MRHRPIQTAPRERVPFTLWGRSRVRQALATATAAAVGLVPGVFIGSPAFAAAADNLTITSPSGWEGGDLAFKFTYTGTVSATFTLTRSGTAIGGPTLAPDGTVDYVSTPLTTVTFAAASATAPATQTITVATGEDDDNVDETFTVTATNSALNGGAGDSSTKTATGTIFGAAANPIAFSAAAKVSESAKTVTLTATSTNPQVHPVTIPVKTQDADSTAHGGGGTYTNFMARSGPESVRDYTALAADAVVTIPAGATTGSVTIDIIDDTFDETDIQYFLAGVDVSRKTANQSTAALGGQVIAAQDGVEIGIQDNDSEPTVKIGDATSVVEGGSLIFPLTLSNPSESDVSVAMTTEGATAPGAGAATKRGVAPGPDDDFYNTDGNVTIPAYGLSRNVFVSTTTDPTGVWEGPENVKATIAAPVTHATLGTPTTANGVITDIEAGQTVLYSSQNGTGLSAFDNTVRTYAEGNIGPVEQKIYVKFDTVLPATATKSAVLDYTFVDGTATNGTDYIGKAGSVTVPAGGTVAEIPVTIIGDRIAELDEKFKLVVTSKSGVASEASLGEKEFIIDDEDSPPVWTTSDITVQEGNTGTTIARVPIKLSSTTGTDLTFTAQFNPLSGDTAVEGSGVAGFDDYDPPASLKATVKAGETEGWFEVPINGDVIFEKNETFTVAFSSADNVTTTGDSLTTSRVTIGNDDDQPKLTFGAPSGPEGGWAIVTPTVVGRSAYQYEIGFTAGSSGDHPATVGADFEIPSGLATAVATIPVGYEGPLSKLQTPFNVPVFPILNDEIDEPTETFTITANEVSPVLMGFATSAAAVKVTDDPLDLPPAVSIADITVNEKDGSAEVPVDLAFIGEATSTVQTVTVPFWTENGTAKAGQDYTAVKGELAIPPGSMKWSIKIPVTDDWEAEGDEYFRVRLGNPGPLGATAIRGDAVVTIKSDDVVTPVTPTLTVSGPSKGAGKVTFSGKAAANTAVQLWGAPLPTTDVKKFKLLATVNSNASGAFTFSGRSVSAGWAFAARATELVSAVKTVKLTQSPSLTLSSTKGKLTASVTGSPKAAGQTVTVYWLSGKTWKKIDSGKTASNGVYKDTWTQKSKAKLTIRAQVAGNSSTGINAGWTAQKTITIK